MCIVKNRKPTYIPNVTLSIANTNKVSISSLEFRIMNDDEFMMMKLWMNVPQNSVRILCSTVKVQEIVSITVSS